MSNRYEMEEPRGWYSRGFVPHIDAGQQPQFITWRLADSLPASIIEKWQEEINNESEAERKRLMYKRVEEYLDSGRGSCVLAIGGVGATVQKCILHDHLKRYDLHAWCVMPNHVHVLLTPLQGVSLSKIMQPLKAFSARKVNAILGVSGTLWQPDYFDRLIRDEDHFHATLKYIEWNPVKSGLCSDPSQWALSSCSYVNSLRISD